jgi:hypothetical protein
MKDPTDASGDVERFLQLVAMFQLAATQQMGKLPSPVSGEIERDLGQAKLSIDMLEMIERKTRGSRTAEENQFLEKVLFELRMNYVDETRRPAGGGDAGEDPGAGDDEGAEATEKDARADAEGEDPPQPGG